MKVRGDQPGARRGFLAASQTTEDDRTREKQI
jgi:hypothetical protein